MGISAHDKIFFHFKIQGLLDRSFYNCSLWGELVLKNEQNYEIKPYSEYTKLFRVKASTVS